MNLKNTLSFRTLAVFAGVALPAVALAALVDFCTVDVPVLDELGFMRDLGPYLTGDKPITDLLLSSHNEHPSFVLLSVVLLNALASDGRPDALTAFSFALLVATMVLLWTLLRRTAGQSGALPAALAALISLIVFTPLQYENLLWGMQFALVIPAFLVTAIIVIGESRLSPGLKLACSGLLAAFGSLTQGSGLAIWPAILAYAAWRAWAGRDRKRWLFCACWLALTAAAVAAYLALRTAQKTSRGGFAAVLGEPLAAAQYFLTYLGSGLSRGLWLHPVKVSPWIGGALLVLAGVLGVMTLRSRRAMDDPGDERSLASLASPWIGLAAFGVFTGLLVTLARFELGARQALDSRYITWSMLLLAALAGWAGTIVGWQSRRAGAVSPDPKRIVVSTAVVVAVAGLLLLNWEAGVRKMLVWRSEKLKSKARLHLVNHIVADDAMETIFPSDDEIPDMARAWNDRGFLRPPLLERPFVQAMGWEGRILSTASGEFGECSRFENGDLLVKGNGITREADRPIDLVLFATETGEIFDILAPPTPESFWSQPHRSWKRRLAEWEKRIPVERIPAGAARIEAFALDMSAYRVYRYPQTYRLDTLERDVLSQ